MTTIEPGPVTTKFLDNSVGKPEGLPKTDQKTLELMQKSMANMGTMYGKVRTYILKVKTYI